MRDPLRKATAALSALLLAGCASLPIEKEVRNPQAGFGTVANRTQQATGKDVVWIQTRAQANSLAMRTRSLIHKKTVTADTAVQVALLNNKGLQAAYAEIGISSADVWQETMFVNPRMTVGFWEFGATRALEAAIIANIFSLMTRERRVAIAEARFRQAQLRAAEETLRLAADTRRAWLQAVGAAETVRYLAQAQETANAASELAMELGKTGAFTKTAQAREHALYAELAGQAAEARMNARTSKEALTRLMGVWGNEANFSIPSTLPRLPQKLTAKRAIEAEALKKRVDLEVAKWELEALARSYGLTQATRYVTDFELLAGVEFEKEEGEEGEKDKVLTSPNFEVEFAIPIFDTGKARMRTAEFSYMRAANQLAEKAVQIRSEAREAFDRYRSTYQIARHYRDQVLPLRTLIEKESLLTYNGMITNTFELLADTREKVNAIMLSVNAKQNFWLAEVDLGTAVYGGGAAAGGGESAAAAAASGGEAGGH
jgi:outer membrane protein TolC